MKKNRVIVWFRQDLRLHDNEALTDALKSGHEVVPIYVFDDRVFKDKTRFGFPKTGKFRAKFIIESVQDLQNSLHNLGSELIIRIGIPEVEIFKLAQEIKSSWVFCNRERTRQEVMEQDALEKNLWSIGQEIIYSRGKMLYYTQDLPFPVTHTPDTFSQFRKEVEKIVHIREPLPTISDSFNPLTIRIHSCEIPRLEDFGHEEFEQDERAVLHFKGGEKAALERLHYFIWESNEFNQFKENQNCLLGADYSSKFSPWLGQGCLSPKMVYSELKKHEEQTVNRDASYCMFLHLMRRDFFRLMCKKHGSKTFLRGGIKGQIDSKWKNDKHLLQIWMNAKTGLPFVDANMRELKFTGYISNRGRQNAASFLVNDLNVNWQLGAEYFESMLIDYDPCSNYINWNLIAGISSDSRDDKSFNILAQAKRYDPKGEYVKHWIPELSNVPVQKIHRPDTLSGEEQANVSVKIGADYPKAMINLSR